MGNKHRNHAGTGDRKRGIIQSALECFAEKGFVETTIEDIRDRSGASTGSIYHHFKGKDGLAGEVYIEGIQDYQAGLLSAVKDMSARDGICEIVRYHLGWVGKNPLWSQYLFAMRHADFMKGSKSEDTISRHNEEFNDALAAWFRKQTMEGSLRRLPGAVRITLVWGPCQMYAKSWLAGNRNPDDLKFAARELGEAAWMALRAEGKEEI